MQDINDRFRKIERDINLIIQESTIVKDLLLGLLNPQNIVMHEVRDATIKNAKYALPYIPAIMRMALFITLSFSPILIFIRYIALKYSLLDINSNLKDIDDISMWMIMSIISFMIYTLCIPAIKIYFMQVFSAIHPKWGIAHDSIDTILSAFGPLGLMMVLLCLGSEFVQSSKDIPEQYIDIAIQYIKDWLHVIFFCITFVYVSLALIIVNNKLNKLYIKQQVQIYTNLNRLNHIQRLRESNAIKSV